ncbi:GNAT family N-acetyltransferase [Paracraurococcus lichenis]|uniref:GNAT family N-acetyltransferase n=1 Tax=Paracraurococcus lichenis TaxID=3064888 RepID=A0ABT9DT67_9PROT|nr:GNAT family N-acetyltransferase [Paracraurococcus sp. LOR1-02]MDO9707090.1 GNAT family N-acetyltransferase [Paracraurococcus sp. LOR1-02]
MELPPGLTLSIEDAPDRAEAERLGEGLEVFNERLWPGHQPWGELGVFLREAGRLSGGLFGETYAGWLFIRYLWLAEHLRGHGLGAGLIAAAELRARERGCHSAYVDTFSFQAPDFYARQGYQEFARLPYPPKGERIWLRKRLTEDAP